MSDYKLTDSNIVIRKEDGANIPDDINNSDRQLYLLWLEQGGIPEPADSIREEDLQNNIVNETQKRLDNFAQTRNYSNVDSASKYKDITDEEIQMLPTDEQPLVLKFRSECRFIALVTARTWAKLYLILDEIKSGNRPIPNNISDIEADLPALEWPQ